MRKSFQIFGRAVTLWWREFVFLMFLNIVWLALQITIIAGPPATAAIYAATRRVVDDELLEPRHVWNAMHQLFWPAWKWGAVNLVVLGVVAGNFWFYHSSSNPFIAVFRIFWAAIAVYWFITNLFYWPFWLAQEDRRMRTIYRNCLLFLGRQPVLVLTLAVLCFILIIASVLTTLPLAILLMVWLALIGLLAVDLELKNVSRSSIINLPPDPEEPVFDSNVQ